MDAIYYHPDGYRHHFRDAEVKDGIATLRNDEGILVYSDVPISTSPKVGHCVVDGYSPKSKTKQI